MRSCCYAAADAVSSVFCLICHPLSALPFILSVNHVCQQSCFTFFNSLILTILKPCRLPFSSVPSLCFSFANPFKKMSLTYRNLFHYTRFPVRTQSGIHEDSILPQLFVSAAIIRHDLTLNLHRTWAEGCPAFCHSCGSIPDRPHRWLPSYAHSKCRAAREWSGLPEWSFPVQ